MVRFMLERAAHPLGGEVARLPSTQGRMWWAMFSGDGRRIVTTDDGGAQVWDEIGHRLFPLPHGSTVYQAVFSPDGTRILTAGADGFVKVWDASTGSWIASLSHERSSGSLQYSALAVSPDGTMIAAVHTTGTVVQVWDLRTGKFIREFANDADAKNNPALEFSHDNRWLATTGGGDVRVYDTTTWQQALVVPGPEIRTISFDPTGPRLATASRGDVSIWTVPGGVRERHLHESGDRVHHVAFSPDGAFVVAAAQDGTDRIWNARTGDLQVELKNHHSAAVWAEFDPKSRLVVSSDVDGVVAISDVALRMTVGRDAGG